MTVGKVKIECVSANYRYTVESDVFGYALIAKYLFARPFIDARCTRTIASKLSRSVLRCIVVGPVNRDLTIGIFYDLRGFDGDSYIPS